MLRFLYAIILMVFLLAISFCQSLAQEDILAEEVNIFGQDESCVFPCWYGLYPSRINFVDALSVLGDVGFFTNTPNQRIYSYPSPRYNATRRISVTWWYNSPYAKNIIHFDDELLHSITITNDREIYISDIIEMFGEPFYFHVYYNTTPHTRDICVDIKIYYPEYGLALTFNLYCGPNTQTHFVIIPQSPLVNYTIYQATSTLEDLFEYISIYPPNDEQTQRHKESLIPWQGVDVTVLSPIEAIRLGRDSFVITPTPLNENNN